MSVKKICGCKWCGNSADNEESFTVEIAEDSYPFYQVHCLNCGAVSPLCESVEEAIKVWNRGYLKKQKGKHL